MGTQPWAPAFSGLAPVVPITSWVSRGKVLTVPVPQFPLLDGPCSLPNGGGSRSEERELLVRWDQCAEEVRVCRPLASPRLPFAPPLYSLRDAPGGRAPLRSPLLPLQPPSGRKALPPTGHHPRTHAPRAPLPSQPRGGSACASHAVHTPGVGLRAVSPRVAGWPGVLSSEEQGHVQVPQ